MSLLDHQNNSIATFCEVTGCDINKAKTVLESVNWNIESAVSLYYEEEHVNVDTGINDVITDESHIGNGLATDYSYNVVSDRRSDNENRNTNDFQDNKSESINKFNQFMKIFMTICGTGLAAFLTFFKSMFCFPEDSSERRSNNSNRGGTHINNATRSSVTPTQIEQIVQDRRIREEQDIEYMRSLNLDSMKQEKANKKKKMKELLNERRIRHRAEIESEVNDKIDDSRSRVCVKNSAGKKFHRDFSKNDKACKIYKWIDSLGLEKSNFISDRFSLRLPHSKSIEIDESYLGKDITIEELGLFPSALLLINNIEEDSNDEKKTTY
ncbi:hypothetical protein RS030_1115 [Cryptosporidium xiaoi]|uniref:UBX domain-containing protein n=1 Tax=Cryptosporidium xiaoi TaxID=659607 RepID=A0AAV9XY97_9CRYT